MALATSPAGTPLHPDSLAVAGGAAEHSVSGVSWAAIIGGALAALSITLLLIALGTGVGLTSVSPWSYSNPSATTFSLMAAVWLIIVQWLSSAAGGYLAGRLRTKWARLHADEVFFRDTAHGFLAWALATVVIVAIATSAISSAAGTAGRAAGSAVGGMAAAAGQAAGSQSDGSMRYFVDSLFRQDQPRADAPAEQVTGEAARILGRSIANGTLDPGDRTYLAKLVAVRTGMSQQDAEKRVDDVMAQVKAAEDKAKQAADAGRKVLASTAFFTCFSMLIGAFIASAAGALGGRQRDEF